MRHNMVILTNYSFWRISKVNNWKCLGRTLLMLLGGGLWFDFPSVNTPSSQESQSLHPFSLKCLSIGTTWPSVVKMYLLSDLCSGLSSSNSWNATESEYLSSTKPSWQVLIFAAIIIFKLLWILLKKTMKHYWLGNCTGNFNISWLYIQQLHYAVSWVHWKII